MRLLHCVETLHRNAGGLPVAVVEMASAQACADEDCRALIAASHSPGEIPHSEALQNANIAVLQNRNPFGIARQIAEHHREDDFAVVHQHGLWTPMSLVASRFARSRRVPLVISPHGMLEPWARRHHAFRKNVAWQLYQKRALQSAGALVASADPEADELRELGFRQALAVIPHGVRSAPGGEKPPRTGPRTLLMLSRIHAKKGIDLLLDAWARIDAPDWQLVIAGNDDGGERALLEEQADRLRLGERVKFRGAIFGAEKHQLFRNADLFVLPSHSENFGIVVAEALQHGLPVITTTGTPWHHLKAEGCGWCVVPTSEDIQSALEEALGLSDDDRSRMGRHAVELVEREHRWDKIANSYLELYRWLQDPAASPRPGCLRDD